MLHTAYMHCSPNKDIIIYWILSEVADITTFCHRLNWPFSKTVFLIDVCSLCLFFECLLDNHWHCVFRLVCCLLVCLFLLFAVYGRPMEYGRPLYFVLRFLLSFYLFPSPNLSGRRLDVCHTSTHGVALARIYDAGLKRAACGSLKIQYAKNRRKFAIWASSHKFVGLYLCN